MNEFVTNFLKTNEDMFSKDQKDILCLAFERVYLQGEINGMMSTRPELFVPRNPYIGN